MDSREKFFKIYANLPINLRSEIILVINDEPITWRVAHLEISNKTPLGKKMLQKLKALHII